ncbi:LOW QUALITY PROTEIN: cytochrome c oxidase assembly protein COX18, mitochondrial-like [Panthera uncia]|uniref:LOW QUALITY PROTEIN: cytochrome c oxidase assembly protein COX18, mitochondrial-like n=1 Tax=Panthera uncia TaxID=29064 RepID=UPI0020FFAA25|nr:LOW QUALITY PROTEIN: cytochrome c oxidase assembly protein COX18, mitochondrial-like [Panthera uncia]
MPQVIVECLVFYSGQCGLQVQKHQEERSTQTCFAGFGGRWLHCNLGPGACLLCQRPRCHESLCSAGVGWRRQSWQLAPAVATSLAAGARTWPHQHWYRRRAGATPHARCHRSALVVPCCPNHRGPAGRGLHPPPPPLLPHAYWHYVLAKVENLQPEIKSIARHLNQEGAVSADQLRWSKRVARPTYLKNTGRLVSELYVRDNCHPLKATVLVWIRFPMWIFMSVALWNFSTGATHSDVGFSIQEQLPTSGVLWFPDLTALDSSWILLISVGVISLLIMEIFALQKIEMTHFQMYITCFVRVVSVLMIPIAATLPSSIVVYCLCSRFMGLSQNLLLHSPGFCQLCQIPLTKSDSDTPCKDLFAAFYAKFISRE